MALKFMYITNNPQIAKIADRYGVERVWVDLETLGKEERQKNINSVKSQHKISDISKVKSVLKNSEMLVRVNPWNENSVEEINAVINEGADIIMLPMWKTSEEVRKFLDVINGRAKTTLLLETKEAVDCVDDILELEMDEIHIGLNDLHLSYGLTFMFELLANGTVEMLCDRFKTKGIPYGFGGIAKLGDGLLPAEHIVMEHYRLGSTRAILSRTFCDNAKIDSIEEIDRVFSINMKAIRSFEEKIESMSIEELDRNKAVVEEKVASIVDIIRNKKNG